MSLEFELPVGLTLSRSLSPGRRQISSRFRTYFKIYINGEYIWLLLLYQVIIFINSNVVMPTAVKVILA